MATLRILHVSDLHMREQWLVDQSRVLEAFLRDLQQEHAQNQVDLVVFTGDLAFSGKQQEYERAFELFLKPLEEVLSLPRARVVLAPGNHDIDRDRISSILEAGLASQLTNRDTLREVSYNDAELQMASMRLAAWAKFREQYYEGAVDTACGGLATLHRFCINGLNIGVAALCSSWRATGRADDLDRAHLLVGERQITETLGLLDESYIRVAAMHHPLDWLADYDRADVQRELSRSSELVLTGHVHIGDFISTAARQGTYVQSAAGSLYADRAYLNSYSLLKYHSDSDRLEAHFRTYYNDRDEFGSGENLIAGGIAWFDLKHLSVEVVRATNAAALSRALLSDFIQRLVKDSAVRDTTTDSPLIEPIFLPLPLDQYLSTFDPETGDQLDKPNIDEDLASGEVILLAGEESAGLTSALAWLLERVCARDVEISPAIIDFGELGTSRDPLDRALRQWLIESGFNVHPRDQDDPLPPLAVCVDNFDPASSDKRNLRVLAHIATGSQPINIIGCRPFQVEAIDKLLAAAGIVTRRRYLGRFGRRHIRELSAQIDQDDPDRLAESAIALFHRERIPRTPFMIIVILEILAATNYAYLAGSETDVLSAHADRLLGRAETSEDQRFDFDYRNRQHLISRLAFEMTTKHGGQISRLDAEGFVLNYLRLRDQSLPVSDVVNIFLGRRLLWERNGILGFRQPAMLHFFTATAAIEDDALRDELLADPVKYSTSVRHAAMLRRDDRALLEAVSDLLGETMGSRTEAGSYFAPRSGNGVLKSFNDIKFAKSIVASAEDAVEKRGSVLDAISADPDFDQILDNLEQHAELYEGDEISLRDGPFGLLQVVSFCGNVLRSSELVTDTELRLRTLQRVLKGYATAASEMSEDEVMDVAEQFVTQLVGHLAVDDNDEFLAYVITMFRHQFPAISAGFDMSTWVASSKLSESIRAVAEDTRYLAQPGQALMLGLLWLSCSPDDCIPYLRKLLEVHSNVTSVVSVVHFIAAGLNLRTVEDSPLRREVEELYVEAATGLVAYKSPNERNKHRQEVLERIRRERLQRAFRSAVGVSHAEDPTVQLTGEVE